MKKLNFSIEISRPPDEVWKILWDESTYGHWTSAFAEGSYAVSDWKQGSDIKFLSLGGDGLYSKIETLVPNRQMVFRHISMVKDGKNMAPDVAAEAWSGAREAYTLTSVGAGTILSVELDSTDADADYFQKTFPLALDNVRKLAETGS
jgi:hypothetical protein